MAFVASLHTLTIPSRCTPCGSGTWSVDPSATSCAACPDEATCAGGSAILLDDGYWRSAYDSDRVRRCKYAAFCEGGANFWPNVSRAPLTSNAAICSEHHEGPLCALCNGGYKLDSRTGVCVSCGESSGAGFYAFCVVVALLGVLGVYAYRVAKDSVETLAAILSYLHRYFDDLRADAKILLVFYQIVGSIPVGFPNLPLPRSLENFYHAVSVFDLDLVALLAATCVGSHDYLDRLVAVTLIPLAILAFLLMIYAAGAPLLEDKESREDLKASLSSAALVVSFLVFTTCSNTVLRSTMCDSEFDDTSEAAHSPYYGHGYLVADYSVDCDTTRYKNYRFYALLMILVYPVGVPLTWFCLLVSQKHNIAPADADALARRALAASDGVDAKLAEERAVHEALMTELDGRRDRLRARYHSAAASAGADLAYEAKKAQIDARLHEAEDAVALRDIATTYLDVPGKRRKRGSVFGSGATAAADFRLGENLKVRHRELCDACAPLKFLYDEYDPACWYFEVLECVRRLVLTCFLPLPESLCDPESISHAVFACTVAVLFAFLYAHLRPFLEDSVDTFANIMQALLFLNVFAILVMAADEKMGDADEKTGLSHGAFGFILIAGNSAGAFSALFYSLSTNSKVVTAALHARVKARREVERSLKRLHLGHAARDDGGDREAETARDAAAAAAAEEPGERSTDASADDDDVANLSLFVCGDVAIRAAAAGAVDPPGELPDEPGEIELVQCAACEEHCSSHREGQLGAPRGCEQC